MHGAGEPHFKESSCWQTPGGPPAPRYAGTVRLHGSHSKSFFSLISLKKKVQESKRESLSDILRTNVKTNNPKAKKFKWKTQSVVQML